MADFLRSLRELIWPTSPPPCVKSAIDAQANAVTELVEELDRSRSRYRLEIDRDLSRQREGWDGRAD